MKRNFIKKISSDTSLLDNFIDKLLKRVSLVEDSDCEDPLEILINDIKDRPILRAAINSNADLIITGDSDFLDSPIIHPKPIRARDFLENY